MCEPLPTLKEALQKRLIGVRGYPRTGTVSAVPRAPARSVGGLGGIPVSASVGRRGPFLICLKVTFSLVFHPRANGVEIEVRAAFLRGPEITEVILSEIPCRICPFSAPAAAPRGGGSRQQIKY